MRTKNDGHVFPASIPDPAVYVSRNGDVYRIEYGNIQKIFTSFYSIIHCTNGARYRAWDVYVRTFYGEMNAPIEYEKKLPEYDLLRAEISIIDTDTISINDVTFKRIPEFPIYFISDSGMVYSTNRNRMQKHYIDEDGYHKVDLWSHAHHKNCRKLIHHLVYHVWKNEIIPDGMVLHHKDSVKWHNYPDNLEITTSALNLRYATNDGLMNFYDSDFYWTNEKVEKAAKMMHERVPIKEIASSFGYDKDTDEFLYNLFLRKLYILHYSRSWKDILSKYNVATYHFDSDSQRRIRKAQMHTNSARRKRELSEEEIKEIRKERAIGISMDRIAEKHDLHYRLVKRILSPRSA